MQAGRRGISGCGALFTPESLLLGNPAMDSKAFVVQGPDGRATTIAFNPEHPAASQAAMPVAR
jgi:hypothetical protein